MIHSLRRRHGLLILGLAAFVPLLVIAALAVRPASPIMPTISGPPSIERWTALGPGQGIHALIETEAGKEWLHLVRHANLSAPDALVYWSPDTPGQDEPFPAGAVLLGELGDVGRHTFGLPVREVPGTLLVYSLAHRSVVVAAPLTRIQRIDRGR